MALVLSQSTGLSMEFDKIHLKDAIVTWSDMHSFSEFDKFEPISNFAPFLERIWLEFCQIPKTTNQNESRDDFFVRRFDDLTNFEPKSLRICQFQKRRTIEVCQIAKTKHVINFSKRNLK